MLDIISTDLTFYLVLYVFCLLVSLLGLLSRLNVDLAHKHDSLGYYNYMLANKAYVEKEENDLKDVLKEVQNDLEEETMDRLKTVLAKYDIDADKETESGLTIGDVLLNIEPGITGINRIIAKVRATTRGKQPIKGLSEFEKIIDEEIQQEIEATIKIFDGGKDIDPQVQKDYRPNIMPSRALYLLRTPGKAQDDISIRYKQAQDDIRYKLSQPVLGTQTPWGSWDFTKIFLRYAVFKPALYMTVLFVVTVFAKVF